MQKMKNFRKTAEKRSKKMHEKDARKRCTKKMHEKDRILHVFS